MVEEADATPRSIKLSKDIIKDGLPCWVFESFFPCNSSIVKRTLPNHLLHFTCIPYSIVDHLSIQMVHYVIPLRRSKILEYLQEKPGIRDLLAKNLMLPMKSYPRSILINIMSFHNVNDANGINLKLSSQPCNSAMVSGKPSTHKRHLSTILAINLAIQELTTPFKPKTTKCKPCPSYSSIYP